MQICLLVMLWLLNRLTLALLEMLATWMATKLGMQRSPFRQKSQFFFRLIFCNGTHMYPCTIMHAPIFFQILNNKLHGQQHPWHNINNTLNTTPTNDKNADHTINIWGREQSLSFFLFVIQLKKEKKGSKFVKEHMKYFKIFYFWNKIK